MKTENKTQGQQKTTIGSRINRERDIFQVPNPEPGKHYCWARKSQVEGTDISPLPDGWVPTNRKMSTTGAEGDQKATSGMVCQGDLILCEISDADYKRNVAEKRELAKSRLSSVQMKSTQNRYYKVEAELKQEVHTVEKLD